MNRTWMSIGVLATASAFLIYKGAGLVTGGGYDPSREVALMEESRGFALGRRLSADLPGGGTVVFLDTKSVSDALRATSANLLAGLEDGAGRAFQVQRVEAPPSGDTSLPAFLQERLAGNAHLQHLPEALAAHPGAVAVVTRIDPGADLPPTMASDGLPLFYVLGFGEPVEWEKMLAGGRVHAVQVDRPESFTSGSIPRKIEKAAEQYYRVIPAR